MTKFTFVWCLVAVSLTSVTAASQDETKTFQTYIRPIVFKCATENDVTMQDIKTAQKAGKGDAVKPCFFGCLFKKIEVINEKGLYDLEKGMEVVKKFTKNQDEVTKYEEAGKKCVSVNDKPVTDGEEGCDRALLLITCGLENGIDSSVFGNIAF